MKISIPFEYEVSFIPHRHRSVQRRTSAGRVEVEVREAARGSVRLVHQVGCRPTACYTDERIAHALFPQGDGARGARVVEHGGRLYVETCTAEDFPERVADLARAGGRGPFHVHPRGSPTRTNLASVSDGDTRVTVPVDPTELARALGGIRPGSYKDDGGKAVADRLRARADELLLHDGSVFAPTSEPVLVVRREHDEREVVFLALDEVRRGGWSAFEYAGIHPLHDRHHEVFPIDRRAEALAYAEAVAADAGAPFVDLTRVEAVDPASVWLDGNWLLMRAARALEFYLGNAAMSQAPAVAEAIGEFRDALAAEPSQCSARLVAAADGLLRGISEHGLAQFPEARPCAALATGAARDMGVEVAAARGHTGLAMLVHASAAMARAEQAGLSWARGAGIVATPATDGENEASEILSVFEAGLVADKLRAPASIRPAAPGECLVAVSHWIGRKLEPLALVRVDASLEVTEAFGPEGRPVPPHVAALARAQAARVARGTEPSLAEIDEADAAAFDF